MDMEPKFGQMAQSIRENGRRIKQMERVNFGMLMVIFLKVSGRMIKQMVMEHTFMLMALNMKGIG